MEDEKTHVETDVSESVAEDESELPTAPDNESVPQVPSLMPLISEIPKKKKREPTEKQKMAFERCRQIRADKNAQKAEDKKRTAMEKRSAKILAVPPEDVVLEKAAVPQNGVGQTSTDAQGILDSLKKLIDAEVHDRIEARDLAYSVEREGDYVDSEAVDRAVETTRGKRRRVPPMEPQGVRDPRSTITFL